jgi:predicted amidohydrolase
MNTVVRFALCLIAVSSTGTALGQTAVTVAKPSTVKVAAIQCSSRFGDPGGNRAKIVPLVEKAAAEGAKIIVLPEACVTGYLSQNLHMNWRVGDRPLEKVYVGVDPAPYAETVPGTSTKQFCELAKRLGVYITVPLVEVVRTSGETAGAVSATPPGETPGGMKDTKLTTRPSMASAAGEPTVQPAPSPPLEREGAERYYNTVCLASPKGEIVAHYRKLTPWPYPEKSWATAGDRGVQVYDTEYGRVGLAICYDIHTILEKYKPYHIWALLYPIAWVDESHPADWFWHKLPERVAKFDHYVIGANWSVDKQQKWYGYGFSEIIAPDGEIVASSHKLYGSDIVYATISTSWNSRANDLANSTTKNP